ncbi:MAG TPA: glycosyltransferase [Vicinamibacterales bacterium]|nr:glycosyltransferase [Vicinamibacterales bacterium]
MKILWLSPGLLLPLDKGGKLRTWHLMRHLARRHHITFLSFADPDTAEADRAGMSEVCAELVTVSRREPRKGSLTFLLDAASYIVRRLPYAVGKYRSADLQARLVNLLATGEFDLVVCDFLAPVANVPAHLPCPSVLFTHNVEAEIWRRHAETARSPLRKALLSAQWRRTVRLERDAVRRFDLVLAVSDTDRRTLLQAYGPLRQAVQVVPTGVDTRYFADVAGAVRPRHMVFTGSMDWLPNEDGMLYFVRDVLPLVRSEEPDATLAIVGRAPTPAIVKLGAERGVEVTGRVDDVRPYMAAGAVYIVPLRIGGGTRLKIFEAMAMGKPVVSTTIGAEGLPVEPGADVLIADTPGKFADAVVRLFRSEEDRARISEAGRRLVTEQYDWSAVFGHLEQALEAAARGSRRHATPPVPELELQTRN